MLRLACSVLVLLAGVTASARAWADDPVATYAIVVGSNSGGPGQTTLRYAEDDARRVGKLLTELSGYPAENVEIVVHPSPDELRDHIAKLADKLAADDKAGRASRVLFYYSGHARATALDLGDAELPLAELRQRLFGLPAKLTVVVLDACQSGAFSRVKGAEPAADFSFNSRQQLDATGVAVLASSSGSELSQESEALKGSYFTHHLLVGLRGAGDTNGDGQVTVDEAYRYAYHQTLLATTETAVGGQHVSFEVDLKGHGEVPLSYPRSATAHIDLPSALEGQTLIEDKRSQSVVAETYKAKGAAVRIAVAPGEYRVLVRHGVTMSRCDVDANGMVDIDHCEGEAIAQGTAKGGEHDDLGEVGAHGFLPSTRVEVGIGIGSELHDGYTQTLENFGYQESFLPLSGAVQVNALRRVHKYLWVGGLAASEASPEWTRSTDGLYPLRFSWSTLTFAGVVRGELPSASDGPASRIKLYAQLVAGLGVGLTKHRDQDDKETKDTYMGPMTSIGGGIMFGGEPGRSWFRSLGYSIGYSFEYGRVIDNLVGDTHGSGGHRFTSALSYTF